MLKRKKQIIAKVMATTMLASTLATTFTPAVNAAEPRATVSEATIAGGDRYKTAVDISKNYTSTSKHAVIVNGEKGIVDALTATPYASLKNAPILMTQSTTLNSDTKAELTRRGITTVDIVGGTKSVDDKVKAEIEAMGITVNRIAGKDKYDTALEVAKKIDAISDISKIAVANGEVLADAVSVAAPAAQNKMPIILVHPTNGLDANTKTYINGEGITNSYVIGGTTSVSDTIKNTLPGTKERLSGAAGTGRQETNAAVVKKFYPSSTYDNIYVAKSGQVNKADEIADALAVGVLAASKKDPVMLVGNSLVSAQKTLLDGKKVEKITKVGNGIPTASITAIKDTQKDPEATVSTVTLVNYKTIKITGKELDRIDKSKVSISGNTTSSYTANSAGTEATIEFASAFSNGTNTVKVTSNLGTVTSHTFTYSTGISTVEATTKEVGTEGIQYLEFTVNGGQKRSIEELKALGWTVEFKSSKEIFYNEDDPSDSLKTSKTGKLMNKLSQANPALTINDVFDYEVILTNGTQTIKTAEKKSVTVTDTSSDVAKIDSYDIKFSAADGGNTFISNKLLDGEVLEIKNIMATKNDGTKDDISDTTEITSSDPTVLTVEDIEESTQTVKDGSPSPGGIGPGTRVTGKRITARKVGTATLTIKNGNVTTTRTIQVLDATENARVIKSVKYYVNDTEKKSINLTKSEDGYSQDPSKRKYIDVVIKAYDNLEDPIDSGFEALSSANIKTTEGDTVAQLVSSDNVLETKKIITLSDGSATIRIASTKETGTGTLTLKRVNADNSKTDLGSLSIKVAAATGSSTYTIDKKIPTDDLKLDRYKYKQDSSLTLQVNKFDSNGVKLSEAIDLTDDDKYDIKGYDTDILTVSGSSTGELTITPNYGKTKTGSTTISVYDKVEKITTTVKIEVVDTTPVISDINLKAIADITKLNSDDTKKEFNLLDLFKIDYVKINDNGTGINDENQYKKVIEGITVKGYENQEVILNIAENDTTIGGAHAILFIDRGTKNGTYDTMTNTTGDFILASLKIELSSVTGDISSGSVKLDSNKDGGIVIGLYNGAYSLNKHLKDVTVKVNIPK